MMTSDSAFLVMWFAIFDIGQGTSFAYHSIEDSGSKIG